MTITASNDRELIENVSRLRDLLQAFGHPRADEVSHVIDLHDRNPEAFLKAINSNRWWAGAESLAAETMNSNPGLPEDLWLQEVRYMRELFIAIGESLMASGGENPGVSSWVLAFRNWNASGV
jgi:hypothetical protein